MRSTNWMVVVVCVLWRVANSIIQSKPPSLLRKGWQQRATSTIARVSGPVTSCKSDVASTTSQTKTYREMVLLGEEALMRLIEKTNHCVPPTTDTEEFVAWSRELSKRKWKSDVEFRERVALRELRKEFAVEIAELEQQSLRAKEMYDLDPNSVRIIELDRQILNGKQAVFNMERLLQGGGISRGAEIDETNKLASKIAHVETIYPLKREELAANIVERDQLREVTPTFFAYQEALDALSQFYDTIGLDVAEKNVGTVQKKGGQGRNTRGRSFENTADAVLTEYLVPLLADRYQYNVSDLLVVRNIKLGMASSKGSTAELDSVICVRAERPPRIDGAKPRGSFCRVLAVVEVKRNPDDLGNAFVGYQKSLAWLSGLHHLYDPAEWVTKAYPTGHFERPFLQDYNGESLIFTHESFSGLRRNLVSLTLPEELSTFFCKPGDEHSSHNGGTCVTAPPSSGSGSDSGGSGVGSGGGAGGGAGGSGGAKTLCEVFAQDLFFVTKDGALDCVHSKAMSWVINKIAGEVEFDMDLTNNDALESLRLRVEEKHPHRMSTLELLRMFNHHQALTGQVFVVSDVEFREPP